MVSGPDSPPPSPGLILYLSRIARLLVATRTSMILLDKLKGFLTNCLVVLMSRVIEDKINQNLCRLLPPIRDTQTVICAIFVANEAPMKPIEASTPPIIAMNLGSTFVLSLIAPTNGPYGWKTSIHV